MAILDLIYNNPLRIKIAEILTYEFLPGVDSWIFVHFLAGFLILFFLVKIFKNKDKNTLLITTTSLLVLWEIYELFNFITTNRFFIPETPVNQVLDLIVGVLGALLYIFIKRKV